MLWYGTDNDSTVLPTWNSLEASPPAVVPKPTACVGLKYTFSLILELNCFTLTGKVNVSAILEIKVDAVCAVPVFVPLTTLTTFLFLNTLRTETNSGIVPIPTVDPTDILFGIDDT